MLNQTPGTRTPECKLPKTPPFSLLFFDYIKPEYSNWNKLVGIRKEETKINKCLKGSKQMMIYIYNYHLNKYSDTKLYYFAEHGPKPTT